MRNYKKIFSHVDQEVTRKSQTRILTNDWKFSRKVTPVKRKQSKVAKIYASIRSKLVWKILQNFVQNAKLSSSSEMIFKSTENFLGKLNTKKDSSNTTTSKV